MANKTTRLYQQKRDCFYYMATTTAWSIMANAHIVDNAITALGWFAQNYPARTLTDGTKMTNADIANMVGGAINGLTLGMGYWMDERGTATYHENKAFSDLMQYQMTHKNNLKTLAKRSATYLKTIGAL